MGKGIVVLSNTSSGHSPELVPVVESGALSLATGATENDRMALDDLLSDAVFGEVIDISDLIPSVFSTPTETVPHEATTEATRTAELRPVDGGEILGSIGSAEALAILYDEDILVLDGRML